LVGDPRALIDRLTAAQNAHDLEAMLDCFQADYRSEQPLFPSRDFQGIDQVRANWSALLEAIPDSVPRSCGQPSTATSSSRSFAGTARSRTARRSTSAA
jgi:hypothetical protein